MKVVCSYHNSNQYITLNFKNKNGVYSKLFLFGGQYEITNQEYAQFSDFFRIVPEVVEPEKKELLVEPVIIKEEKELLIEEIKTGDPRMYENMTYTELKSLCAQRGLDAKGKKEELINRLKSQ